jgi:hypothetical protein
MNFENYATVKKQGTPAIATPPGLEVGWLRQICPEVGADDFAFVEIERRERARERHNAEDSRVVRLGSALALVILCLEIGFHYALNRALTRVSNSMNCALLVFDDVDSIVDGLDRLSLNQRFLIRTGDPRFAQDMYESVMGIERQMDSLRQVARKGSKLGGPIAELDRAVDLALSSLRRSNEVERSEGSAAAIRLLDKDGSIAEARREAQQLRNLAANGVFDRVRAERGMKSIFDLLF